MEENSLNSRIKDIIEYFGMSTTKFAKSIGINQSVLGTMFTKGTEPSAKTIMAILSTYQDISAEWLMRGIGNMIIDKLAIINDPTPEATQKITEIVVKLSEVVREQGDEIDRLREELKKFQDAK